jgi:hypothetical protein
VRKLVSISIVVSAAALAAPVAAHEAQEERRPAAQKVCTNKERCTAEPRRAVPWFFHGQDEGAQVRRIRRISYER